MKKLHLVIMCAIVGASCSPSKTLTVSQSLPALAEDHPVKVYNMTDMAPADAVEIGTIKLGDTGFSVGCSYEKIMEMAKQDARKQGGNAIKITSHRFPSAFGSSCHRIQARILSVSESSLLTAATDAKRDSYYDEELSKEGCAMIHLYRFGGPGVLVGYDVKIGDETIARLSNNSKKSVKVEATGVTEIWARTESKAFVTVDLKPGYHYYIKGSLDMGVMVGRPFLQLVDNKRGEVEYNSLKTKERE